jgi:ribonuclease G
LRLPESHLTTWLIEEGIGEHRAIRIDGGTIAEARIDWPGMLAAGQVADAVLVSRAAGSTRGTLRFPSGEEALVDGLSREAMEGAPLCAEVTRAAIAEKGRFKRAQARPINRKPAPAPSLARRLAAEGHTVRTVRRFFEGHWDELVAEAWDGVIDFSGGSLTLSPTPAMTLIDIDGTLPPPALALAAVPVLASAIRRLDLAGSIGIDFPTLAEKPARRAVDEALAGALTGWLHERTAINGFGFVQLVARLERPSLLHRIAHDPAGVAARQLLRRAERLDAAGALLLTAHPAVLAAIVPEWRGALAQRTGRTVRWQGDAALALQGGHAQIVEA